jgi:hypothetical protein
MAPARKGRLDLAGHLLGVHAYNAFTRERFGNLKSEKSAMKAD